MGLVRFPLKFGHKRNNVLVLQKSNIKIDISKEYLNHTMVVREMMKCLCESFQLIPFLKEKMIIHQPRLKQNNPNHVFVCFVFPCPKTFNLVICMHNLKAQGHVDLFEIQWHEIVRQFPK